MRQSCKNLPPHLLTRIWHLAWPLMLANASAPLLGLVDTGLMGRQPDSTALAAVAIGANLFGLVAWGFNLLTMATSGSTAWIMGESGLAAAGHWLRRLSLWVLATGLLLVAMSPWLIPLGLRFYDPSVAVADAITTYLGVRVWSAPLVLLNLLLAGWFIGVQRTRVNLNAMLCAQLVNILVSVFLVFGLGLGVAGVAFGSVMGDLSAFFVYSLSAWRLLNNRLSTVSHRVIPNISHYLTLALPLLVRTLTLLFAFNYFARLGLGLGQDVVAANALLLTFLLVVSSLIDGFANAAEALVGQAAGARDRTRAQQAIIATGLWSFSAALVLSAVFAVAHPALIALLTDLPAIRELAGQYAIWMILMPLYTWWAYWLDGVFIGLQWVRAMRNVLLLTVFGVYWPLSLILPMNDNHQIWALFAFMMALRSVIMLALVYQRWQRIT